MRTDHRVIVWRSLNSIHANQYCIVKCVRCGVCAAVCISVCAVAHGRVTYFLLKFAVAVAVAFGAAVTGAAAILPLRALAAITQNSDVRACCCHPAHA